MQRLPGVIFEQDNARPHKARVLQDCLRTVTTLSSPVPYPQICLQSSISGIIWDGDYTRAYGDIPRHFEPWSSDVDDTRAGTPSPNYHTIPTGGHFISRQIERALLPYTVDLYWGGRGTRLELMSCLT
ncbi:hypothetical protein TNCV_217681 [Trichonephila clavipes]|nr:hypothetical protein TNCV_217681 [Trichonephila clavipes]